MTAGNYTPLSPQSFLRRNARVFPHKTALHYGTRCFSYAQFYERTCRQAQGLMGLGIAPGDKVCVLAPNIPPHLEAHFGVHMAGGVLVSINTRLSPGEVTYIIQHSEARVLIVDGELLELIRPVMDQLGAIEHFIVIVEPEMKLAWQPSVALDYEAFLAEAGAEYPGIFPADENDVISINYTSGTTGNPKGVMYTHRSAYLNGVCNLLQMHMNADSVYLWTLPMFHCNGWCYPWGVTAMGATHICLRSLDPGEVVRIISEQKVSHFCGAPIVLRMVADSAREARMDAFTHPVKVSTAAAPPSPAVIVNMLALNVEVIHVYGLTETYGPTTVCEIQPGWRQEDPKTQARLMARQGVPYILSEDLQVLDDQDQPVAANGQTMGEVCMRGNIVMKGYYKNPEGTAEVLRNGWFHSGDLGVIHPDGYIELKDRAKDIIISGGENISTIEVENTLLAHADVQDAAVVGRPDPKWGEAPVAFVTLREEAESSPEALIAHCREHLAHFKAPKEVYFQELPRTSTGKVQKFLLRERFWGEQEHKISG